MYAKLAYYFTDVLTDLKGMNKYLERFSAEKNMINVGTPGEINSEKGK